jgi:hypothetical protein
VWGQCAKVGRPIQTSSRHDLRIVHPSLCRAGERKLISLSEAKSRKKCAEAAHEGGGGGSRGDTYV